MKRTLTLAAVAAVALTTVAVALGATTILKISADKIKLAYNTKTLTGKAGKVTISMSNPSVLPHNVAIRAGTSASSKIIVKGQIVGKGGTSKVTATLKKGRYRFVCTVPGHEAGGMWGILTIK